MISFPFRERSFFSEFQFLILDFNVFSDFLKVCFNAFLNRMAWPLIECKSYPVLQDLPEKSRHCPTSRQGITLRFAKFERYSDLSSRANGLSGRTEIKKKRKTTW